MSCSYKFDGEGGVLAHAFAPRPQIDCIEIHLDSSEKWNFNILPSPSDHNNYEEVNLYAVLIHEIGHTLGLGHSAHKDAIMYPYYSAAKRKLGDDDEYIIQALYGQNKRRRTFKTSSVQPLPPSDPPTAVLPPSAGGRHSTTQPTPNTNTTISTTTSSTTTKPQDGLRGEGPPPPQFTPRRTPTPPSRPPPDLCSLKPQVFFLHEIPIQASTDCTCFFESGYG
ncbi:hypothetical protein AAG570_011039 [Ranatra chinensis]|uniref:Peptidase M10 metallopeptidase domain-containing protein n=1 Tax=Ranatra chinensis TaxID=642074 RepID=A0ABD0YXU0_9HEMI